VRPEELNKVFQREKSVRTHVRGHGIRGGGKVREGFCLVVL
jgi:hypothetical protein